MGQGGLCCAQSQAWAPDASQPPGADAAFVGSCCGHSRPPETGRGWLLARGLLRPEAEEEPVLDDAGVVHIDIDVESHYQLGQKLGRGSCGTICRVHSRANAQCNAWTGLEYAAKVVSLFDPEQMSILHGLSEEDTYEEMTHLWQEINALRQCRHPHVVELVDVYYTERRVAIVMELADGGDLAQRLDKAQEDGGIFREGDAAGAIRCTCLALAYVHAVGIVHRDVKPDNLIYVSAERAAPVKLADFGLAYHCENQLEARQIVGTPMFMAPEMLAAEPGSKSRTREPYAQEIDLWAVGVTAYLLLFRVPPFQSLGRKGERDAAAGRWAFPEIADEKHPVTAGEVSDDSRRFLYGLLEPARPSRLSVEAALRHAWLREAPVAAVAL